MAQRQAFLQAFWSSTVNITPPLLHTYFLLNTTAIRRRADKKHLESFEMWSCRRLEKISWTDRVRNNVMYRVKKESFEMWSCRRLEKISWTDRVRNDVMYRVKEERKI